MSSLQAVLATKRVIVCCGAGGVGKTTTSAALALGAARAGKKVLVLTIDPSRRLAETLGVSRNTPEPVPLRTHRQREAGIEAPGRLSAWVLDPKHVSDATVKRLVKDPTEAARLLENPIYQQVTQMIAGMQEYTAMEALHGFVEAGTYDVVILDTPPSRNALNFLEAPSRLGEFLDGRIFKLMVPQQGGRIIGTSRRVIQRVLSMIFGDQFHADLQVFFSSFASIFSRLNGNAQKMAGRLREDDVAFLLITSPARDALDDAFYFEERIRQLDLPLGGVVVNRSRAPLAGRPLPGPDLLPADPTPEHHSALAKLMVFAEREQARIAEHDRVLQDLREGAGQDTVVMAVPEFGRAIEDLRGLAGLSEWLIGDPKSELAAAVAHPDTPEQSP